MSRPFLVPFIYILKTGKVNRNSDLQIQMVYRLVGNFAPSESFLINMEFPAKSRVYNESSPATSLFVGARQLHALLVHGTDLCSWNLDGETGASSPRRRFHAEPLVQDSGGCIQARLRLILRW
jgi:hypothetical protein